jgi:signal transduction histidine kinase
VRLETSIAADTGPALVAPQQISRVLDNLLANAIRYTPPGGSITVRVARVAQPAAGGPGAAPAHPCILFEVEDTGEGIAAEDLPYVFERFYRGEKSRSRMTGGAGLGLAIARGIVEAHGGAITIESAPERGTRVRFTIPCPHQSW